MEERFLKLSHPGELPQKITVPPSKSQCLRAILFATFARGTSYIQGYLDAPDTHKVIEACRGLGATITIDGLNLIIEGTQQPISGRYDLGNSGIALRFLTGILATFPGHFELTGDASLQRRPMEPLHKALKTLESGTVYVDGRDSQMVSSLIFAGLFKPLTIHVENPGEIPWVQLSLSWLDRFGIAYTNENFTKIRVESRGGIEPFSYAVPSDFSSASYPIAAAVLTGQEVEISGLDFSDPQGDKALIDVLSSMGARFEKEGDSLAVLQSGDLQGATIDLNPIIDALPLLAVIGCAAKGKTTLFNGAIARTKECDRIEKMALELRKMGAHIEELPDGLVIYESSLHGADLESHGDQRLVLALSVAALIADGPVSISDYACYTKTFPNFFRALNFTSAVC